MLRKEFEERIGRKVTPEEFDVINAVYMDYPYIGSSKDFVADLYLKFGMIIFMDLYPRALKAQEMDKKIRDAKKLVNDLIEEKAALIHG